MLLKRVKRITIKTKLIFSYFQTFPKTMPPELQEEFCKNFTYGNPVTKEFFSPGFPRDYPPGIKCFRTISADYGDFVRADFRDYFNIEPPTNEGNCDYDYLEVRKILPERHPLTKYQEE